MRKTPGFLAVTGLFVTMACGGRDQPAHSQQQQYETVQEGAASGVTSTIHGPGETIPPMTGTNADTTSAFTLDPNLATAPATPPGTLAGALPTQPYGGAGGSGYIPSPTRSVPPPPRGDTTTTTAEPVPTTTTAEPPPTDTTTTTAPPPPETQTEPPPPPEAPPATDTQKTDTQPTPPPPPPPV